MSPEMTLAELHSLGYSGDSELANAFRDHYGVHVDIVDDGVRRMVFNAVCRAAYDTDVSDRPHSR